MSFNFGLDNGSPVLPVVITAGFLDSINPCAIAVLLIFIALMFTLRKSRRAIIGIGAVYIMAVYLTYLGIGLGILRVVNFFNTPHFLVKLGAFILIAMGVWGLKEEFFPGKFRIRTIPLPWRQKIAGWATKGTIWAAIVTGFLVALGEFPCSGAVYLATIALLGAKETFAKGLAYLLLYNLAFITPLLVLLGVATNRLVVEKMINLDEKQSSNFRFLTSLAMIALGIIIYNWLT